MSTTSPSFSPAPPPGAGWAAAPPHVPLPPPGTPVLPPAPAPRTSGLAVVAVVLASLALAASVVSALWSGGGGLEGSGDDGGYGPWGPLTGQVAVVDGGLSGDDLESAVSRAVERDGGVVGRMSCPDTAAVDQNVTTVCHAVVDEYEWAMVVFFEDDGGRYTILPV